MRPTVIAFALAVLSGTGASAASAQTARDEDVSFGRALGRAVVAAQMTAAPGAKPPAPPDLDALARRLVNQSLAVLRSLRMRFFVRLDPSTALRRVLAPVLTWILRHATQRHYADRAHPTNLWR